MSQLVASIIDFSFVRSILAIKERKFKATGDKHWFDQFSPPEIPAYLQPFVKAG